MDPRRDFSLINREPSAQMIVSGRQLTKRYRRLTAVDHIDISIDSGECFGFLGPNGAGKTTTIRMITTATPLSSGDLTVAGYDVRVDQRKVKHVLGIVPQEDNLDSQLTVRENLLVYARYFDIRSDTAWARAEPLLDLFHLSERADSQVDELSGGMRRRLLIARGLINEPKILILDEPTTGLDPQARYLVWQKLRLLRDKGTTMILTTHYMEEATQLCDRIAIMNRGKIIGLGTPNSLIASEVGEGVLELKTDISTEAELEELLPAGETSIEVAGDTIFVYSKNGHDLKQYLDKLGERATYRPANLEDVFLQLTGRALVES